MSAVFLTLLSTFPPPSSKYSQSRVTCHIPQRSDREPPEFPGTSPHIPFQQSFQLIIVNPAQQQYTQTKQDSISQHQIPSPDLPVHVSPPPHSATVSPLPPGKKDAPAPRRVSLVSKINLIHHRANDIHSPWWRTLYNRQHLDLVSVDLIIWLSPVPCVRPIR